MNCKNNNLTQQPKQGVFFYPKYQYFKIDDANKLQLNDAVLILTETYPGSSASFFQLLEIHFKKDSLKKQNYSFFKSTLITISFLNVIAFFSVYLNIYTNSLSKKIA